MKKLGSPIMTNLYYGTIKQLLERISSVMIDREAVQHLVGLVKEVSCNYLEFCLGDLDGNLFFSDSPEWPNFVRTGSGSFSFRGEGITASFGFGICVPLLFLVPSKYF